MSSQQQPSPTKESSSSEAKENIAEKVFQKGNEHYTAGDLKKAEMAYSRALLYHPTDALKCTIVSNRCAVRIKLGNLVEAKHDAEETVRLNPCWGKAHFRLGDVYLRMKDLENAWIHLRRSVELDSSNTYFRKNIDRVEDMMEKEGLVEKLKELKNRVTNTSAVQFLPNIDLLSTNLEFICLRTVWGVIERRLYSSRLGLRFEIVPNTVVRSKSPVRSSPHLFLSSYFNRFMFFF